MKRLLAVVVSVMLIGAVISGCGTKTVFTSTTSKVSTSSDVNENSNTSEGITLEKDYQTRNPEKGETVAVLHTNHGDISMRFLDKAAPKAVENFITLAKDKKYDNTIFHRVINNFMIQGGNYTNFDGTGGESCWGTEFENECVDGVSNIRGSVAMANAGPDTNGSQFYINQNPADNAYLDGGYTVFGWVYDGMDVVDEIAAVETSYNNKPVEDVVVTSVDVFEYEG